jgi:hypothetical protein
MMAFKQSPDGGASRGGWGKYAIYVAGVIVILGIVGFIVQRCG